MGVADKIAGSIFLDYKEFVVYGLGMGASLFAPFLAIFSPLFSFIVLLSYNILKKIDKQKAKIILIIISLWIAILPIFRNDLSYFFNTTFASFIFGLCIVKVLEQRRFIAAFGGYLGAMIAAIFSSALSLDYSFYLGHDISYILPDVLRRFDLIWNNELVIIAVLLSILLMVIITYATKDPVFGFSVSFLFALTFMWVNMHLNVGGNTQLWLLGGF